MDILELVDRLEELFNESRAVPFTHSVIVDEDRMLDIIDQMRVTIPEEVKQAREVLNQRDRILARAKEEAQRTIQLAQEERKRIAQDHAIVHDAMAEAERIRAEAYAEAVAIRREADEYALRTLQELSARLEHLLAEANKGIQVLQRLSEEEVVPPKEENAEAGDEGEG